MTRVRSQLRSGRSAYRLARYPGDLAAEMLPRRSAFARVVTGRRRYFIGAGASAAAALVLSLLLSRAGEVPQPRPALPDDRALADWFPIAPGKLPLPQFRAPGLPLSTPEMRLPLHIPAGVERYQDLAMRYRELQVPDSLRRTTVPTIPVDLPTRGVEWFQRVWTGEGEKSA